MAQVEEEEVAAKEKKVAFGSPKPVQRSIEHGDWEIGALYPSVSVARAATRAIQ